MQDLFDPASGWGDVLHVVVTSRAASNRIKINYDADGNREIRVYVTAIPEHGKANEAVLGLLANEMGLPKRSLTITHGEACKHKTIKIRRL